MFNAGEPQLSATETGRETYDGNTLNQLIF